MPLVRPISDLRDANGVFELCHSQDEPVFLMKNGCVDLVVMSKESYERQQGMLDLYKKLGEAEADLANGDSLLDADEVFSALRAKYAK